MIRFRRFRFATAIVALLFVFLTGCNNPANPDLSLRSSAAREVLAAARAGDQEKLLQLAAPNMVSREEAAAALIAQVEPVTDKDYEIGFRELHSPEHQEVRVHDPDGDSATFKISWNESGWQLILGEDGPPKSPAAKPSPEG